MGDVQSVDIVVGAILGVALLRGVFLGLIREAFSIAALGGACIAVRFYAGPFADWLGGVTGQRIPEEFTPWVAGALLAVATVAVVAFAGRLLRRGAQAAGLGWADRAGGAVLGTAEGALVAAILLVVAVAALGRDHPFVAESRSLAALQKIEQLAEDRDIASLDVAAPPPLE